MPRFSYGFSISSPTLRTPGFNPCIVKLTFKSIKKPQLIFEADVFFGERFLFKELRCQKLSNAQWSSQSLFLTQTFSYESISHVCFWSDEPGLLETFVKASKIVSCHCQVYQSDQQRTSNGLRYILRWHSCRTPLWVSDNWPFLR